MNKLASEMCISLHVLTTTRKSVISTRQLIWWLLSELFQMNCLIQYITYMKQKYNSQTSPNPALSIIHSTICLVKVSGSLNCGSNGSHNSSAQVLTLGKTVSLVKNILTTSKPTAGMWLAPVNHLRISMELMVTIAPFITYLDSLAVMKTKNNQFLQQPMQCYF